MNPQKSTFEADLWWCSLSSEYFIKQGNEVANIKEWIYEIFERFLWNLNAEHLRFDFWNEYVVRLKVGPRYTTLHYYLWHFCYSLWHFSFVVDQFILRSLVKRYGCLSVNLNCSTTLIHHIALKRVVHKCFYFWNFLNTKFPEMMAKPEILLNF